MVWNMSFMTFHILGMSSSQLLLTPWFFRGVGLNHQHDYITVMCLIFGSNQTQCQNCQNIFLYDQPMSQLNCPGRWWLIPQRGVREIGILSGDFGSKFRLIPWKDVEVPQYMWDFEGWRLSMDFIRCFGTFSTLSGDFACKKQMSL